MLREIGVMRVVRVRLRSRTGGHDSVRERGGHDELSGDVERRGAGLGAVSGGV